MVNGGPVPQTFQDHLMYHRMITVQCISAAAEIVIISLRCQQIIDVIIESLEGKTVPHLIAFSRVIKYHIQNTFDAVLMKFSDHLLQFRSLSVIFQTGSIAGIGREETDCIIAPVVHYRLAVNFPIVLHLVKLKNRHQFHCIDAKLLQVGDFFF